MPYEDTHEGWNNSHLYQKLWGDDDYHNNYSNKSYYWEKLN
jgi:hypothetical protein